MSKKKSPPPNESADAAEVVAPLRIVGGTMRGRKLEYLGDVRTRPMKDRVREAVFNLLGPGIKGMHAYDLFAGTGAIGLEAISRGAVKATFVERHFPTADAIARNAASLGATDRVEIIPGNTFISARRLVVSDPTPWVAFISPPWDLFDEQPADMLALIVRVCEIAPPGSMIVVEADERFDMATLPSPAEWDVRTYFPAIIALWCKPS